MTTSPRDRMFIPDPNRWVVAAVDLSAVYEVLGWRYDPDADTSVAVVSSGQLRGVCSILSLPQPEDSYVLLPRWPGVVIGIEDADDLPGRIGRQELPSDVEELLAPRRLVRQLDVTDEGFLTLVRVPQVQADLARLGLSDRIRRVLAESGRPLSSARLRRAVGGRAVDVNEAVAQLAEAGIVIVTPGPRGARLHTLTEGSRPCPDSGLSTSRYRGPG